MNTMTREQMLAWFTIEGWAPVKYGKFRGFSNGMIFVHWKSDSIRSIRLVDMVAVGRMEPAHNMKRFPDRQARRCMDHIVRMRNGA